jgi:hypothetical protein
MCAMANTRGDVRRAKRVRHVTDAESCRRLQYAGSSLAWFSLCLRRARVNLRSPSPCPLPIARLHRISARQAGEREFRGGTVYPGRRSVRAGLAPRLPGAIIMSSLRDFGLTRCARVKTNAKTERCGRPGASELATNVAARIRSSDFVRRLLPAPFFRLISALDG